jgi:hypothetical protein
MFRLVSTFDHGRALADISSLSATDILHVYDVFDQSYIDDIFQKGIPRYFINDHIVSSEFEFMGANFIGLPLWLEATAKDFINCKFDNEITTFNCFNFIINKKQINRYLCIKLVEFFGLTEFDYTWSAVDTSFDCSAIITEMDWLGNQSPLSSEARSFILSPIQLGKKFITPPENYKVSNISISNYGSNLWTWENGLQKIFSQSAISLITESVSTQRAMVYTEKTLYAVLGLTFPIWIGGYNQAKEWTNLGFDTFDDIIDHSYQYRKTLIERCYHAVYDNLDLLQDKNKLAQLRLQNTHRLLKNRELLLTNHLGKIIDQTISELPTEVQAAAHEILKSKFFRGKVKSQL